MGGGGVVIYDEQLTRVNSLIGHLLKESDAKCALLVGKDGRTIARQGFTRTIDTDQLGALVAGAFSASKAVAELIGEPEFSTLFHQGKHESIQIHLLDPRTLLVVTFDERTTVGMVRLVTKAVSGSLREILQAVYDNPDVEEIGTPEEIASTFDEVFGDSEPRSGSAQP